MKPEHFKEFNVEHAQAGAPYCQRNGLAARIGIWDGKCSYPLGGFKTLASSVEEATSWSIAGLHEGGAENTCLVMLPLGYCEGKPVFVGDELVWREQPEGGLLKIDTYSPREFDDCKWPHKAPVMPTSSYVNEGEWTTYDKILAHHLSKQRSEIEAYWKALDEFNRVTK